MSARIHTGPGHSGIAAIDERPRRAEERPPPARIRRRSKGQDYSYEALRELTVGWTQALSGEAWTDYNLHDPGVTLLEALCYATTENIYAAEQDLADLLTAADGRIHYRRHALHTAPEALPARPTTHDDALRALLDQIPGVERLHLHDGALPGLQRLRLQVAAHSDPAQIPALLAQTARAYWAQRNLGEDLDGAPQRLDTHECTLEAEISIQGAREIADLLAELIHRCANYISARPPRTPYNHHLAAAGRHDDPAALSELLDGPLLRNGWIDPAALAQQTREHLYFGDLRRVLQQIDGIAEIRHLQLRSDEHPAIGGALPWQDADWTLQLRWPRAAADLAGLRVSRRGMQQRIPVDAVLRRLEDLRNDPALLRGHGSDAHPGDGTSTASLQDDAALAARALALPQGRYVAARPYFPAYNHLPPIYHGASGALELRDGSDSAVRQRRQRDQAQLSAYMSLLEQWLAHGETQTQHLRELYTVQAAPQRSYWWQILDARHLPALAALYTQNPDDLLPTHYEAADAALERRSRVLDHLLALYGEGLGQSSIKAYGYYFSATAWQAHLYRQKFKFLRRIIRHTRDRAAGIDYSRASFGRRGNTAPLQQRISILLGFLHTHSRSLCDGLQRYGLRLDPEASPQNANSAVREPAHRSRTAPDPARLQPIPLWGPARQRINERLAAAPGESLALIEHYFPALAGRPLPPALLRCAVHAERYYASRAGGLRQLWLGPDNDGQWFSLMLRPGLHAIELAARCLHEYSCRVQLEGEGLHLIEHALLWPLQPPQQQQQPAGDAATGTDDVPERFYAQQLSLIFPAWTARGADQAFRELAAETVSRSCPAHLLPHLLWLDAAELQEIETAYRAWLEAKQAYCQHLLRSGGDPRQAETQNAAHRLDEHAATLRRALWAHLRHREHNAGEAAP